MNQIISKAARQISEGRVPRKHTTLSVLDWIVRRTQRRGRRAA
jgi:hypothetical protein